MSGQKGGKHARNEPRKRFRPLKVAIVSVASLLIILVVAGAMILNTIKNPQALFTPPPARTLAPSGEPMDEPGEPADASLASEDPEATQEPPVTYDFGKDRVNILLLGQDSSIERVKAGMNFRTDSMILVSFDLANYDVDMISIPRDSYVRINGGSQHAKINAAFVYGGGSKKDGYQYAMDTVAWTLGGIRVDYYVGYGMQAVKDVVDAMGGIDYDVDIAFTMNGRRTQKGMQRLDGQKALDYARFRGSGRGDIDRVDRQQRLIFAMFSQLKSTDQITNIPAIYSALMEEIDTNLNLMQIASLAYWGLNLDMSGIERHTLDGYGTTIGNTSYHVLDQDKKKALVKEIFDVDIDIPEGEDYTTILAMAREMGARVSELMGLIDMVSQGIREGYMIDAGAQSALVMGQAALMSEKDSEVRAALEVLRPYASIQAPVNPPTQAPTDMPIGPTLGGNTTEQPTGDGGTGSDTGQGSLGGG